MNNIQVNSVGTLTEKFAATYGYSVSKPTEVQTFVRPVHEDRILAVLRERGAMSRADLAQALSLSRTTLSEITSSLLARGALSIVDTDASIRAGSGRPAERLALDPASSQYLGVDFGHRRVQMVIADAAHEIIASGSQQYSDTDGWDARLASAFDLIKREAALTGIHFGALQGIAIGVPGPYTTVPLVSLNEGWGQHEPSHGIDKAFSDRFGAPVIVDNNTRFAALAEALGTSSEAVQDLIYLRLSDGVGGGLVIGGRLIGGSAGLAGELGHVTAVPDGDRCRCGKLGCLETVASVTAILAICRARGVQLDNLSDLRSSVERGDPTVDTVLHEAGAAVGRVLGSAAMTLNPSSVVIGGEITQAAPVLVEYAHRSLRYELSSVAEAMPTLRAAELTDMAGALGGVATLLNRSSLLADYGTAVHAKSSIRATIQTIRSIS